MNDPRSLTLHHVGFVVDAIAPAMEGFLLSLNASWNREISEDPLQKVKVAFLSTRPGEPQIELIEPVGDSSPVRKFLLEKGGGLHHFCYETDDLEAELKAFRSRRAILVRRPVPAVAFHGRRIAWVLTREKLLVELLEKRLAGDLANEKSSRLRSSSAPPEFPQTRGNHRISRTGFLDRRGDLPHQIANVTKGEGGTA